MKREPITALLLASGPEAPGAADLVERAAARRAAGGDVRVLLSGDGLAWAADERLLRLREEADVAVCSRNARVAGWTATTTPARVRWSSVATWLAELQTTPPGSMWTALP